MAVFRIEKTQNYSVMSNHHLRNAGLSLKAKGLLSQILSLPENWDCTAHRAVRNPQGAQGGLQRVRQAERPEEARNLLHQAQRGN